MRLIKLVAYITIFANVYIRRLLPEPVPPPKPLYEIYRPQSPEKQYPQSSFQFILLISMPPLPSAFLAQHFPPDDMLVKTQRRFSKFLHYGHAQCTPKIGDRVGHQCTSVAMIVAFAAFCLNKCWKEVDQKRNFQPERHRHRGSRWSRPPVGPWQTPRPLGSLHVRRRQQ